MALLCLPTLSSSSSTESSLLPIVANVVMNCKDSDDWPTNLHQTISKSTHNLHSMLAPCSSSSSSSSALLDIPKHSSAATDQIRRASWPVFTASAESVKIQSTKCHTDHIITNNFTTSCLQQPTITESHSNYSTKNTFIRPTLDLTIVNAHKSTTTTETQSPTPPSVIISDHSSKDHIIHSVIQFDSDSGENDDEDHASSYSIYCSTSSLSSSMGEDDDDANVFQQPKIIKKSSKWRKVQSLVPFIQTYRRKRYPWIQLAGHQGNFLAGQTQGTILKKQCGNEIECFNKLMADPYLSTLVPQFKNTRVVNGETYLELEDLLAKFVNPSVMDIKMGSRTYLEEELVKAKEKPRLRKDMFEKMVAIDPKEPSEEERTQKAITKPRYMIWRETISSTSTLGFRIDGMKSCTNNLNTTATSVKDFKRTKSIDAVRSAILEFVAHKRDYLITYLQKLQSLRTQLEQSPFFQTHEMIGSSLLFVHDQHNANVWMIDFAKTYPLPDDIRITHRDQWILGNHEDGYLFGLDNLIQIFTSLS